jgi:hypothetical protein
MKVFPSTFDFENFIGIAIVIENRFRINRTLSERGALSKISVFQNAPGACEDQSHEDDSLWECHKLRSICNLHKDGMDPCPA